MNATEVPKPIRSNFPKWITGVLWKMRFLFLLLCFVVRTSTVRLGKPAAANLADLGAPPPEEQWAAKAKKKEEDKKKAQKKKLRLPADKNFQEGWWNKKNHPGSHPGYGGAVISVLDVPSSSHATPYWVEHRLKHIFRLFLRLCHHSYGLWAGHTVASLPCSFQTNGDKLSQILFISTPTWGRFPFWLIFFKWVETTN